MLITETGSILSGIEGFAVWCRQRKLPVDKTFKEFVTTKKKYKAYYDEYGIVNGMEKLSNTKGIGQIYLDNLFYIDFYAIERFGKTRLGTLVHFAK